jgi:hypothetical protein
MARLKPNNWTPWGVKKAVCERPDKDRLKSEYKLHPETLGDVPAGDILIDVSNQLRSGASDRPNLPESIREKLRMAAFISIIIVLFNHAATFGMNYQGRVLQLDEVCQRPSSFCSSARQHSEGSIASFSSRFRATSFSGPFGPYRHRS